MFPCGPLPRLGFLDFVERQRVAGQTRLFPELTVGKYRSAAAQYSKRFGRLLRAIGITDHRKVLHRRGTRLRTSFAPHEFPSPSRTLSSATLMGPLARATASATR